MSEQTAGLIAFLRARLDEDERAARAASSLCGCDPDAPRWLFNDDEHDGRIVTLDDPHPENRRQLGRRWNRSYSDMFAARHITRWDPERVLAEVETKRRILDLASDCVRGDPYQEGMVGLELMGLLGLPHASHPEYRDEWRPDGI